MIVISSTYAPPRTSIIRLLFSRGPSHVARFIIAVIIGVAIKGESRWTSADISKESGKVIPPFFTYRNATTTVMFKSVVSWIQATLFYILPDFIFTEVRKSMRAVFFYSRLPHETAATVGMPTPQSGGIGRSAATTVAATKPPAMIPFVVRELFDNDQSPKSLTYDICSFSHLDLLVRSVVRAGAELTVLHRPVYFMGFRFGLQQCFP